MKRKFNQLLFVLIVLVGCSGAQVEVIKQRPVAFSTYRKIAVFPLKVFSGYPGTQKMGEVAADLITVEVSKKGYQVVKKELVIEKLRQQNFTPEGAVYPSLIKRSGKLLEVSAILTGDLTIYKKSIGDVELSANLKFLDVSDGSVLWEAKGYRLYEKGFEETLKDLIQDLVEDIVETMPR